MITILYHSCQEKKSDLKTLQALFAAGDQSECLPANPANDLPIEYLKQLKVSRKNQGEPAKSQASEPSSSEAHSAAATAVTAKAKMEKMEKMIDKIDKNTLKAKTQQKLKEVKLAFKKAKTTEDGKRACFQAMQLMAAVKKTA